MCKITVLGSLIADHIEEHHDPINITSFSWSKYSSGRYPDYEFEINDIGNLEFENDNYVQAEKFDELQSKYDELIVEHDLLNFEFEVLKEKYDEMLRHASVMANEIPRRKKHASFWQFWK